jgi:phage terminase large subunit-like protein
MTTLRKFAEPARPVALRRYPNAAWDGGAWLDGAFGYDERTADRAVAFFRDHLVFSEGEWAGRPFILEDFQEHDIIRPLFGWKREDGTRRYRRAFIWIARKNGKTELAAGVALLALMGDAEPGGQVFSIASEKDQASIVFNKASNMVARAPRLASRLECLKETIYCPALNASFRPLSGKPKGKHGLAMSGLVGDEIHEWPNGDLYTFVHDSAAARRQPLEFLISTAGQKGTHGEEVFKECQAILAGDLADPETLVLIYAPDEKDDWTKKETWLKANPNFGKSVKADAFEAKFKLARQLPRLENDFKRYSLNIWTDQAVKWLPIDAVDDDGKRYGWDYCIGELPWKDDGKTPADSRFEQRLIGKTCFGGVDLSSTNDLSGIAWWFPIQEGLNRPVVLVRAFKPADLIKAHAKRDRIPYDKMVDEGSLFTTPGNVVDYAFIQQQIYRDAERFKVAYTGDSDRKEGQGGLAIDRWNATETSVKLQQEGIPVVLFGQGFASMSAPSKELERLVMANGFDHGGHPLLRRHAQAVAVETDATDNFKPAKDKSSIRIDLIVALIMSIGIASKDESVPLDIAAMVA